MNRVPVQSSHIASIGYEPDTLEVQFLDGRVYQYFGVPDSVYRDLMSARSIGSYFHQNVRSSYACSEV